jgi:hypothetical protein
MHQRKTKLRAESLGVKCKQEQAKTAKLTFSEPKQYIEQQD